MRIICIFIFISFSTPVFTQQITARVLDKESEEPLSGVTVNIRQKADTTWQTSIVTGEDGLYETAAPTDTTVGIGTPKHLESVWLNYTPDHVEVYIADPKLRSLTAAQLCSMNARLVDLIEKEQEGQYSVFRINKNVLGKQPLAFQAGNYGGMFLKNSFRFNTRVDVGVMGLNTNLLRQGRLKSTGEFVDYIFSIDHEGYKPYEEVQGVDMDGTTDITHYLMKMVPTFTYDFSGQLIPGGDTLLITATGTQGTDTVFYDLASPDFATIFESEDNILDFRAYAENDSMLLDSTFTKTAGTYDNLEFLMKEKEELNWYLFNLVVEPEGVSMVSYIRNDPLDFADNDTLYNATIPTGEVPSLEYWSSDLEETLVVELLHPNYPGKVFIETFTPGAYGRNYDLRD